MEESRIDLARAMLKLARKEIDDHGYECMEPGEDLYDSAVHYGAKFVPPLTREEVEQADDLRKIIDCELCQRPDQILTKHHLIPRAVHTKKKFIRRFGKKEMRERGIMICKLCHKGIHDIIPSEIELAESFCTKELLLADPRIEKHVAWVKKQK